MSKKLFIPTLCVLALFVFMFVSMPAQAHPYMYYNGTEYWNSLEQMASEMDNIIDDMLVSLGLCPQWTQDCAGANSAYWRQVTGQDGPYWDGSDGRSDHGTTNIGPSGAWSYTPKGTGFKLVDSRYFALLDAVLDPNRNTNLPSGTVNAIRTAFQNNITRARNTELTIQQVRLRADIAGCGNDKTVNLTTNTTMTLTLKAGLGCLISQDVSFDVPSFLKNEKGGPLAEDADPRLDDALINFTAAYMTLGDQKAMDYWYSWYGKMIQIIINDLLDDIIRNMTKGMEDPKFVKMLTSIPPENIVIGANPELYAPEPESKTVCNPWGNTSTVDFTVPVNSPIGTIDLHVTILEGDVCNSIRNFANNNVVASQFQPQTSYLAVAPSTGNLNGDGRTNFLTYSDTFNSNNVYATIAQGVAEWALRENIFPSTLWLETQPVGRTSPPLTWGQDSWTLSVAVDNGDGTIWTPNNLPPSTPRFNYQWYYGSTPDNVTTPVSGGNVRVLVIDPVDWIGSRYFRCLIADPYTKASMYSNTVEVVVQAPPITITQQPTVNPTPPITALNPFSITCNATQNSGTLSYQWQIDRTFSGSNWENVSDGDSNNVYNVSSATSNDAGLYRCVITSVTFGNSITTGTAGVQVNTPTPVVTLQPSGAMIDIGDSHVFTCDGDISPGGGADLRFQWEKGRVAIGPVIPGPGPVSLPITNAQPTDTGWYRCKISSATYGSFVYTSEVYLGVGLPTGSVYRVDKMAPRPGGVANGLTWETAFATIQEGIDAAAADGAGEVWVAGGPNGGGYVYNELRTIPWGGPANVDGSLILESNVQIYGGFEGYWGMQEDIRAKRAVRNVVTIIDGSVSRGGSPAYHVIVVGSSTQPAVNVRIDGFDIRGGRASGVAGDYHTWRGAGLYNWISQPVIANCTFYDNIAAVSGGAISNESYGGSSANATIINCVFYNNRANRLLDSAGNPMRGGGAIFNNMADPTIKFSTFVGNTVDNTTGGLYGLTSSAIFNYNTTGSGQVHSSIFWQNVPGCIETFCPASNPSCAGLQILESDTSQTVDPLFNNVFPPPTFKLTNASPFVDASTLTSPNYDIQGVSRPQDSASDRGAYELVKQPMNLVCKNISVDLDETGNQIIPANSLLDIANSTVPGGIWKIVVSGQENVNLTCGDRPSTQRTVTVIDYAGSQGTCDATITVNDVTNPTAVCANITVYLNSSGQYTLTASELDGGSTDNCGPLSLSIPPTTYTCANIGQNQVLLTVTDGANLQNTCLATVMVEDNLPPTVVTKNITVDLDETNQATIVPADVDNGTTDNCSIDHLELDRTTFTCADRLTPQTVNLTAYDVNGNQASATAQVTVRDVTPPEIQLRGASYVLLVANIDCYVEEGAFWTDNCDGTGEAVVGGDAVPSNCPLLPSDAGEYVVTYDYTDLNGNVAEQKTRVVKIIVNQPPEITLLGDNPMSIDCKEEYVEPGYVAQDPEDGDLTEEVIVTSTLNIAEPGTYQIEYKVIDHDPENPQTTIVYRTVEVVDNDLPVVTLQGANPLPWKLGTPWVEPGYTADDPCWGGVTVLTEIVGTVDVNTSGMYVITYTPKDYSGHTGTPVERTVYVGEYLQYVAQPQNADAYVDSSAFDLRATISGGIFIPGYDTYEWKRNGSVVDSGSVEFGENTFILTVDPATLTPGTYMYQVEITDLVNTHVSSQARVRIANHISITGDISNAEVVPGDNFSMSVTAQGGIGTLHYQWQKSDGEGGKAWVNLTNGGNISGATSNTLVFTPFNEEDVGQYRCVISDDLTDVIYSSVATLTKGSGIPVAGAVSIALVSALSALAGVFTLRRRQR
ncbi:MAG: immunoglobulin-like domain-containing protein [Candidatus Hydrogenedens sp.]